MSDPGNPAPASPGAPPAGSLSPVQRELAVTACGLLTSLLTAVLTGLVQRWTGFWLYGFYTLEFIPLGAIALGALAASGYYYGALWLGHKPTWKVLLSMIAVSAVTWLAIHYLQYRLLIAEGRPISEGLTFREFLDAVIRAAQFAGRNRNPLGSWGYALVALEVIGFSVGGWLVYGMLARKPFCDRCSRFLVVKGRQDRYSASAEAFSGQVQLIVAALAEGRVPEAIERHGSTGAATPAPEAPLATTLELSRCPSCPRHAVTFWSSTRSGKDWTETRGTRVTAMHEGVVALAEPPRPSRVGPGVPPVADALPEPARWIKENFEAVVVAFIMALVIRCFCLEVFKIPTASMEPTLLGDARDRSRGGDRIMVNKFAYEVGDVERYDVLVFKFPLDLSRNFIKRCVGLPDEDLVFCGGDIYTRKGQAPFALARKPVPAQENVWVPVYVGGCEASAFRERWKSATREKDNWELHEGALRTFAGPGKSPETRFAFAPADLVVYDVERDRPGIRESPHPVPDLRLGARVEFLGPAGEFDLTLRQAEGTPRERTFRVLLRPGAPVLVQHPDRNGAPAEVELKASVKPQTPVDVALLVYDGACAVLLDGSVVHDQAWQTALPGPGTGPAAARASFGSRNAEVLVRDLAVARDLYYYVIGESDPFPSDRPVHIPPACHLLIGDNLRNSHDGRAWRRKEIEFVDGSTVYWDGNLFQDDGRTSLFLKKSDTNPSQNEVGWSVPHERIRDIRSPRLRHRFSLVDGSTVLWDTDLVESQPGGGFALYARRESGERGEKMRTLAAGQVADYAPVPPVTWVERRHIVGKAFAIWWPPGRWFRLIR